MSCKFTQNQPCGYNAPIKVAVGIINSDKLVHSYDDLHLDVTFWDASNGILRCHETLCVLFISCLSTRWFNERAKR